jgi:hypothetical protein
LLLETTGVEFFREDLVYGRVLYYRKESDNKLYTLNLDRNTPLTQENKIFN